MNQCIMLSFSDDSLFTRLKNCVASFERNVFFRFLFCSSQLLDWSKIVYSRLNYTIQMFYFSDIKWIENRKWSLRKIHCYKWLVSISEFIELLKDCLFSFIIS